MCQNCLFVPAVLSRWSLAGLPTHSVVHFIQYRSITLRQRDRESERDGEEEEEEEKGKGEWRGFSLENRYISEPV